MFTTMIFGALVTFLSLGTYSYEECKEVEFEGKACKASKVLAVAEKKDK